MQKTLGRVRGCGGGHDWGGGGGGVQESLPDLSAHQEEGKECEEQDHRQTQTWCGHGGSQLPAGLREARSQHNNKLR